jgi:hypothetical protein
MLIELKEQKMYFHKRFSKDLNEEKVHKGREIHRERERDTHLEEQRDSSY